ncbi:hypothetical protein V496_01486 [Pseudogymnoascus sp. VKM F-4515 (FW-2607)]|nr:hypothetical protein V496_01486 [Pseudogymnoascus sp. VKM F-4515 (FW-2607)]
MNGLTNIDVLKELHGDLARKCQNHGSKIEQIWCSFNTSQRVEALQAGAVDGLVLKNRLDKVLGDVYKVMPEWNLHDITERGPDYLLDLLNYRATTTLHEQYCGGFNGGQGDAAFIANSILVNNLRHVDLFEHCFSLFVDEDSHGQSFDITDPSQRNDVIGGLADASFVTPQSTGELILLRQSYILQSLNILIEDILEGGSSSTSSKTRPRKSGSVALAALSNLSDVVTPNKPSLQDLLVNALDQKSSLDDHLSLCRKEPIYLAHVVNNWFFSRPELVKDERGRSMPLHTDKYISIAIFEAIHSAVKNASIWDYLYRLLQLLDGTIDRIYRAIVLQEISNICYLDYDRAQKLLKRYVQVGTGSKYFRRVSDVYDNETARVSMKCKPEILTRENPQLHYLLRLCQTETNASSAIFWIKKLDDLHRSHPSERESIEEREADSFGDIAISASFIQSLSTLLPLPSPNLGKAQMFISGSNDLAAELNPLKAQIDLGNFAVPINNLLEPGMAEGALSALDQFVIDKTGTKLGILYQDLIEDCVSDIQDCYQKKKARVVQNAKAKASPPMLAVVDVPSREVRIQQRRLKEKTRPEYPSIYEITPAPASAQLETAEIKQIFKVKQDTIKVFSALFSKSGSRGSISWTSFEAAMADLKFSVLPKFGSVFTFFPPEDMGVKKSITFHRPHKSQIEGYVLLRFASKLKRVYGWAEQSFETV